MSPFRLALFLTARDLIFRKRMVFFVLFALGFLYTNLIFARCMVLGFERSISHQIIKVTGHLYLETEHDQDYLRRFPQIVESVHAVPWVEEAIAIYSSPAILELEQEKHVTTVWGVPYDETLMGLRSRIKRGAYFSAPDANQIILGRIAAKNLRDMLGKDSVNPGDFLEVYFVNKKKVDRPGMQPLESKYMQIAGEVDLRDYVANQYCFVPRDRMDAILHRGDNADEIFIRLKEGTDEKEAQWHLQQMRLPGLVRTWWDRDDYGVDDMVRGFDIIGTIIFGVSVVSSAVILGFILYSSGMSKRRQIGMLRAIGVPDRVFWTGFILQALSYAAIGIVTGSGIYLGLEGYLQNHPIIMPFGDLYPIARQQVFVGSMVLFVIIAIVSAFYPAWKICREPIARVIGGT
ncbi:MAG: ABC transporter permease [Candidatus Omnitrophica bacterium]|nr:ABC transporter permease [Candidatus Omnitrophota bacterium]